jgi:hypothetical protein
MKHIFLILGLLVCALTLPGCSSNSKSSEAETTTTGSAMAPDSTQQLAYVCPMACEGSGSNAPGKCKVCEMDLIKNPDHQAAHDSAAHQ